MQQEYSSINWPKYKLISVFREIFSNHSKYTFDASENRTKIHIRDKSAVKLVDTDDRPIVAISRGQVRTHQRFIGDLHSIDATSGAYNYVDLLETNITVNCLSPYGLVAEEIASIVWGAVKYNKAAIMAEGFFRIEPPALSEEQIIVSDSDYQLVSVSVVFNLIYLVYWSRTPQPLLLDSINIRARNINEVVWDTT